MQDNKNNKIRIMLVDDSSVIRGALTHLLEEDPAMEIIASIANGEIAINAAAREQPDIIILDIEMPVMDGLTALPRIRGKSPDSKIIMFSSLTEKGAQTTMKAMALGAVECLVKPGAGEAKTGSAFHQSLLALIKSLCPQKVKPTPKRAAPLARTAPTAAPNDQGFTLRAAAGIYAGKPEILAIGSSTGGPQALFEVLKHCTELTIPIVITQHMPATFTKILAEHISRQTGLTAYEGENGMLLEGGKVYVAPGGFHMTFEKSRDGKTLIVLEDGAPVNYCKPSVEPMLGSLLPLYGNKILGLILTGMGHDGRDSCKALSAAGGRVIAQDEASSVVWGMPGAVATAGICNAVLPLTEIGPWIKKAATGLYTKPVQV